MKTDTQQFLEYCDLIEIHDLEDNQLLDCTKKAREYLRSEHMLESGVFIHEKILADSLALVDISNSGLMDDVFTKYLLLRSSLELDEEKPFWTEGNLDKLKLYEVQLADIYFRIVDISPTTFDERKEWGLKKQKSLQSIKSLLNTKSKQ